MQSKACSSFPGDGKCSLHTVTQLSKLWLCEKHERKWHRKINLNDPVFQILDRLQAFMMRTDTQGRGDIKILAETKLKSLLRKLNREIIKRANDVGI
jgi:hypothetical protein